MFPQRTEAFDGFVLESLVVPPGAVLPTHTHPRAHMLIVFDGIVCDQSTDDAHEVSAGELIVRPAGITHCNSVGETGAHVINVDMMPSLSETFEPLYGPQWASARLTFPMVRHLPEQIRNEMAAPDPVSHQILPGLVEQLLGVGARVMVSRRPEWLRRAVEMLERSFVERISVTEVARWAGVSPSRLSHGFREHLGRSVGDYLRDLRVDAAARALAEGEESIAAIAVSCGFADQAHLSRTFRDLRGMTPTEYRRMIRVPSQSGQGSQGW